MSRTVHYLCPNCNGEILHEIQDNGKETDFEVCGMCGTKTFIKDLENKPTYNKGGESEMSYAGATSTEAMISYIDEAESALAYIENYFENYDWDDFMNTSALSVPAVDKAVDKILMKSAAESAAWELQFMAVNTPLVKKFGGLKKLENKFFDEYVKKDDIAESFEYFDTYRRIVNNLLAHKQEILKKLNNALKYYKKYLKEGAKSALPDLTDQLTQLTANFNAIKRVEDYKELPGFSAAQATKQENILKKFEDKQINAEQVYNDAVSAFNMGGDLRSALAKFVSIAGYKDASEYAQKINAWLEFDIPDGIFIRLGRKYYRIKKTAAQSLPMNNLNNAAREQAQQPVDNGVKRYSMYEIVDKKQVNEPCVTGITRLLCYYGGTLYYIKNDSAICSFNSETAGVLDKGGESENVAETVIMTYKPQDICFGIINKSTNPNSDLFIRGNKLFLLKKLTAIEKEEKKGCFAGLFGKKDPEIKILTKNNFALIALNLVTSALETVIQQLVDIHCIYENEIFYDSISVSEGKDIDRFYAYNLENKQNRTVLNAETEIVDVVDGKAVYFIQAPNDYNKDLYTYDFKTGASRLIETNVYEYYRHIDGMFYYYVGNEGVKTLYRVNVDGTGKLEIKNNKSFFKQTLAVRNGWLYFLTAEGINQALVKMSTDGKKYIPLCRQFKKLVTIKDGYIYYVDYFDTLCMVREDGSDRKDIIDNVEDFIEVTDSAIYLLREEIVDETSTAYVWSNSLYRVDFDGAWLKKIAFNVASAAMSPSNKEEIYLYKTKRVTYKVEVPIDKENYKTEYETRDIKTILLYDTRSEKFREVAILDTPDNGSFTFKGGCFKKPVTKDLIITEVPNKKTFKRGGLMQAGATANEQLRSVQAQNVNANSTAYNTARRPSGNGGQAMAKNTMALRSSLAVLAMTFIFMLVFIISPVPQFVKMPLGVVCLLVNIALVAYNGAFALKSNKTNGKIDTYFAIGAIASIIGVILAIVLMVA